MKPTKIHLHKQSKTLEILFGNDRFMLPAEYLRVSSPSAEVRGHGVGQEVLVFGKIDVGIKMIKPSGNYGLQIHFDDGHNTGIYSWAYLKDLAEHRDIHWQKYLDRLTSAGKERDPHTTVVQFKPH